MPDLCTIETLHTERCTMARLIGEVDASNAASIDEELRAGAAGSRKILIIDLNQLEYVDSAGIAALERLANDTKCRIVIGDDATIFQTLSIVRFNAGHRLYGSHEEALESSPG
jgi:anti-anti-sigma factor